MKNVGDLFILAVLSLTLALALWQLTRTNRG